MRIFVACILLSVVSLNTHSSTAQENLFGQASCTIVYALKRAANQDFNNEINLLKAQIIRQNIRFIDLNIWNKASPHLQVSGRVRNQIRQQFDLVSNINQAIVVNNQGQELSRYSGSVTLVNALIDCH